MFPVEGWLFSSSYNYEKTKIHIGHIQIEQSLWKKVRAQSNDHFRPWCQWLFVAISKCAVCGHVLPCVCLIICRMMPHVELITSDFGSITTSQPQVDFVVDHLSSTLDRYSAVITLVALGYLNHMSQNAVPQSRKELLSFFLIMLSCIEV